MFRAICIKSTNNIKKGEIVKAVQGFGKGIHYYKGVRFALNMPTDEFNEFFIPFREHYVVEKPPKKRFLLKPKRCFLKVEFRGISEQQLIALYNHVFSYIELIRQISPELILTFSYSIVSTLERLEYLYHHLSPEEFMEAIKDSEQVFIGVYKTALSIEIDMIPKLQSQNQLLENFKQENAILSSFYKELNRKW